VKSLVRGPFLADEEPEITTDREAGQDRFVANGRIAIASL
jgi:hypothetical protein